MKKLIKLLRKWFWKEPPKPEYIDTDDAFFRLYCNGMFERGSKTSIRIKKLSDEDFLRRGNKYTKIDQVEDGAIGFIPEEKATVGRFFFTEEGLQDALRLMAGVSEFDDGNTYVDENGNLHEDA